MTAIYRLSKKIVVVDGIKCYKEEDGRYYPKEDILANVSLFPEAVDSFLRVEDKINNNNFLYSLCEILEENNLCLIEDDDEGLNLN